MSGHTPIDTVRALLRDLILARDEVSLQALADASRSACLAVVWGDDEAARARYARRIDLALEGVKAPVVEPLSLHTVAEVDLGGVVRRLTGDAS